MVTALAERRDDLAGLIGNLNDTTRALGNQKEALAESIERLPPFMRRANTTFVNLRSALDAVDPLVEASKPVAKRLGPFLSQARAFAADASPTVRDLSLTIRKSGRANDLINLMQTFPPLADIATVQKDRSYAPGGTAHPVGNVRGAFPETVGRAQGRARRRSRFARPYTTDFLGWFDDFSTTGGGFDALGATAPRLHHDVRVSCHAGLAGDEAVQALPGRGGGAREGRLQRAARRRSATVSAATRPTGRCPGEARPDGPRGARRRARARSCSPARPTRAAPRARTYKIVFDNAFGLTKGGDFRVGGVNAGQTTAFDVVKKQGEAPKAVVTAEVTKPGLRRLPQGRELRDPPAVADRRVLRGLPARASRPST